MSNTNVVNVADRIDTSPVSPFQIRVVILCFLVALIDGFDTQAIAFVAPVVKGQLSISSKEMGLLFSSGLLGLMAGAALLSIAADLIGRKPVIILSCLLMAVFSIMTSQAENLDQLQLFRFLTGLGMGGAMPNINTLTSEYAPVRHRAKMMTIMFTGFPFGAMLGGLISNFLIDQHGWGSVFILGGVLPIILIPFLVFLLPESIRFLTTRDPTSLKIGNWLTRIDKTYIPTPDSHFTLGTQIKTTVPFLRLFKNKKYQVTLLLWIAFFCNLLMMYTLVNWLPSIASNAGFNLENAIIATVIFNLGGVVGGLVISFFMDKFGNYRTLILNYTIGTLSIISLGLFSNDVWIAIASILMVGACITGGQLGMNAFASSCYETEFRATGLGWALAVGRIGSIVGPVLLGIFFAYELSITWVFSIMSVPAVICVASIYCMKRVSSVKHS